ncbi:PREDICTED: uncharacterized protein LOC104824679, partial [Tarenaya hassleriana]
MLLILGLTDNLSMALQRKDQDILNAISLVKSTKRQLQQQRDAGWNLLLDNVSSFCEKHNIEIINMEEDYVGSRRLRKKPSISNLHHYQIDCFYTVMDFQLREFNDRFDEVNSELLICMAALSPIDSFRGFNMPNLVKLAGFYPDDFSFSEQVSLRHELSIYFDNLMEDDRFSNLVNLGDLARLMVETKKHLSYPLVYRLLKLALILPVATATVERCFSSMNFVKTALRNRIGDQ